MSFKSKLNIQYVEGTEEYKLLSRLVYITHKGVKYIVNKNFISDGHSIPKILRSLAGSPFAKYPKSAWLHDWLCQIRKITRKEADIIYKQAMKDEGASWFQCTRNYIGVRLDAILGRWK